MIDLTLKEKVAEVEPNAVNESYWGNVAFCPCNYKYLNVVHGEITNGCIKASKENCTKCWNQKYKEVIE